MTEKSNLGCALIQILTALFRSHWVHSQGRPCWTRARVRQPPNGKWTEVVTGKGDGTGLDYPLQCVRRIRRAPCKSSKEQSRWDALRSVLQLLGGTQMTIQNQAMNWIHTTWNNGLFNLCTSVGSNVTFHEPRRRRKHSILQGFILRPSRPALTRTTSCRHVVLLYERRDSEAPKQSFSSRSFTSSNVFPYTQGRCISKLKLYVPMDFMILCLTVGNQQRLAGVHDLENNGQIKSLKIISCTIWHLYSCQAPVFLLVMHAWLSYQCTLTQQGSGRSIHLSVCHILKEWDVWYIYKKRTCWSAAEISECARQSPVKVYEKYPVESTRTSDHK